MLSPRIRNNMRLFILITVLEVLANEIKKENKVKCVTFFVGDMITYVDNLKESSETKQNKTKKLLNKTKKTTRVTELI